MSYNSYQNIIQFSAFSLFKSKLRYMFMHNCRCHFCDTVAIVIIWFGNSFLFLVSQSPSLEFSNYIGAMRFLLRIVVVPLRTYSYNTEYLIPIYKIINLRSSHHLDVWFYMGNPVDRSFGGLLD